MKVVIAHRNAATSHGLALLLAKYGDFDVVAEVSDAFDNRRQRHCKQS